MFEVKVCPCCGGETWNNLFSVTDHSISHETFKLIICSNCSLTATSPRPEDSRLGEYYKSEKYISHSGTSQGLVNQVYLQARKFALNWKLKIINKLRPVGTLLDFGCGTGEFINHMKKNGWLTAGMEPSPDARSKAKALSHQQIFETEESITDRFNVITLWHVMEHLPDPNKTIKRLLNHLEKDGTIVIAVPNYKSFDAVHYQSFWAGYDVPRHLWHFSQKSMEQILQNHGLTIKKIIPMKLDSFYVSLLSEKYKKSGSLTAIIKGIWIGLKSNLKARRNNEYSSLIYIATK